MILKERRKICEEMIPLIRNVGEFIAGEMEKVGKTDIEIKSQNSLVTYVDKTAEEMLVEGLSKLLPEAGYLTEEETVHQSHKELTWIIDPLDGTNNFLHRIPHFAVSVALQMEEELQIGVVYNPCMEEMFVGFKDGGAFLNQTPIHSSHTPELANAIIATGFPYQIEDVAPLIRTMGHFMRYARGIRRMGAAALDLVYVACGRYDAYYESAVNAWDLAGGAIIVQEAGGTLTDFRGTDQYLKSGEMISCNAYLHEPILKAIQEKFRF